MSVFYEDVKRIAVASGLTLTPGEQARNAIFWILPLAYLPETGRTRV